MSRNLARESQVLGPGESTTPVNGSRSLVRKRRRFDGSDVSNSAPAGPCNFYNSRSGNNRHIASRGFYQPKQSLYDGFYHDRDDDGSDSVDSDIFGALNSTELVKMIQEQQVLLQQVVKTQKQSDETQKKIELRQEQFEVKLQEIIAKSCSSQDGCQKKKVKISRKLTVSH